MSQSQTQVSWHRVQRSSRPLTPAAQEPGASLLRVTLASKCLLRVRGGVTGLREQSRTGESQLPESLSGPNLGCEWERDRMKADHGSVPSRVQDVSPPSERRGEEGEGIRFLGGGEGCRGGERGSASRFHESLEKLPDTSLGAFLSWALEEYSSSAARGPKNLAGALSLHPAAKRRDALLLLMCAPRPKAEPGRRWEGSVHSGQLAGFWCHLAAAARSVSVPGSEGFDCRWAARPFLFLFPQHHLPQDRLFLLNSPCLIQKSTVLHL